MTRALQWIFCVVFCLSLAGWQGQAQEKKEDKKKVQKKLAIPPTYAKVAYGKHERQVLDFYQAKSDKPTPMVLFIHGGGWRNGDKNGVGDVKPYLDAGISVASINYRYTQNGVEDKVVPPVQAPLGDAARALQFIRSKSAEWNIDKKRIGATGGSAGACSSLWLAFHKDMADPKSSDPIARESTRLYCAAVSGAQTSLDPRELREWLPNYTYGAHAFGLKDFPELFDSREKVLPWINEYSPFALAGKDAPPIGLYYKGVENAKPGENHPDPTHSPVMGMKLAEKLKSLGVEVVLAYTGHPSAAYPTPTSFLIEHLKK
jgi:acetyl esterase/lipase